MHRHLSIASLLLFGLSALAIIPGCAAKAGDSCTKGTASCADASNELTCQGDKLILAPCKGAKGCSIAGDKLTCDISANKAGDVCSKDDEGNSNCTPDGKSLISCEKGAYVLSACAGPDGCKEKDSKFECDKSIAAVGEKCEKGNACDKDGKHLLECKDGKLAIANECRGPNGCKVSGNEITCDAEAAQAAPAASGTPSAGVAPDAPPAAPDAD